jgi:hypothetical protein
MARPNLPQQRDALGEPAASEHAFRPADISRLLETGVKSVGASSFALLALMTLHGVVPSKHDLALVPWDRDEWRWHWIS